MRLNEEAAVTAAGAAAGGFVAVRYGNALPDIGPLGGPLLLVVLGAIASTFVNLSGTTGTFVRGAGYGFIVAGTIAYAS